MKSDSRSVNSLPELVHSEDGDKGEDSDPSEPATYDDEWEEDDVEIKVAGDDNADELRGWEFVDSDDEYPLY